MKKLLFATVIFVITMMAWLSEVAGHYEGKAHEHFYVNGIQCDSVAYFSRMESSARRQPQHDKECDTTRLWIDREDEYGVFNVWANQASRIDSTSEPDKYWFIFFDPDCYPDTVYDTTVVPVSYYRQYVRSTGEHIELGNKLYHDTSWVVVVDIRWRKRVHGMTHRQWDWFMGWLEGKMKPLEWDSSKIWEWDPAILDSIKLRDIGIDTTTYGR